MNVISKEKPQDYEYNIEQSDLNSCFSDNLNTPRGHTYIHISKKKIMYSIS